jgi:glycosyltransferase involved in cell wall biosynthesis
VTNPSDGLSPGVSVLTTTYNRADVIGRAVDSVLAQEASAWEMVVIDNASTDGTAEVLAGYTDDRIRVVRVEPNRGCTGGRNVGLENARLEWFTFLDSDDCLVPSALSTLLAVPGTLQAHVDQVMCNCIDSQTGEFTGSGLDHDQWVDYGTMVSRVRGEFNAITRTSMIRGRRFNDKIQVEGIFWNQLSELRRYYIHRGLKVYSTARTDTESVRQETDIVSRYPEWVALLDDETGYLDGLARWAPRDYTALLFGMFRVFLLCGDKSRAQFVYARLRNAGLSRDLIKAKMGMTFGPGSLDALSRVALARRRCAQRLRPMKKAKESHRE